MRKNHLPVGRGLRVLIADDYRDSADTLAMLVRMSGYETRTAQDGEEAMHIVISGWPDIAVLDIEMPHLSGYEVARIARAAAHAAHLALVALTGWSRETERLKAREAGFDMFLTKPVDPEELDAILQHVEALVRGRYR